MTPIPESEKLHSILVVDDDKISRRMVVKYLQEAGYQVFEAENGQHGLEVFDACHPTIVLLDVMMPVMNGFQACVELRKRIPDQTLPILMLTSLDDLSAVEQAFDSGASDFVSKPLNWPLLTQRIRFALRDRDMFLAMQQQQKKLADAQRIARLGYGRMNLTTGQVIISPEISAMLGFEGVDALTTQQFFSMLSESDQQKMTQLIDEAWKGSGQYAFEHKVTLPNGEERVIMQRAEVVMQRDQLIVNGALQDVTEQARAEERILYHTYYDVLTGLPNRVMFEKQLQEKLHLNQKDVVMFIGIDRFKSINDSLGHTQGDALLKEVAKRFAPIQACGFTVARFGGDLFALHLSNIRAPEHVSDNAQEILKLIMQPMKLGDHEVVVSASIGIALYPDDADNRERLLLGADVAMNVAKQHGGGQYRFFSAEMDAQAQDRLSLEQDLRRAIKNQEFVLHYQPQYCVKTRRIVGMEALVRWQHPEKGVIAPGRFIPLAEETGLVTELGEWVLRNACRQSREWQRAGFDLRLGVNLSAKQLAFENIQDLVADVLKANNYAPNLLELEITESMMVSNFQATIQTLEKIRGLGVQTSMDDFGTGYSSLSYLQQLPINTLKIDRAFIKDITGDGQNGEIAKAIVALSKSLGLHTIAEGVEKEGQYQCLAKYDCDEIQGFYFSRPLPVDEFSALLKRG